MKFHIIVFFLLLSACSSNDLVAPPEFNLSEEERQSLISKFEQTDYNIYFLLMVDRQGVVVRSQAITRDRDVVPGTVAARFAMQVIGDRREFITIEPAVFHSYSPH